MDKAIYLSMVQAGVPTCLTTSRPGAGKTAFVRALAKAFGKQVHTETLSQCDPTDFGWPREDKDGIIRRRPLDWLANACNKPYILFFDEISLAPRSVLAAALRIINERECCAGSLHADTWIIAAMNPSEFTGVTLPPQLLNRFAMVDFSHVFPRSAWIEGMVGGFPTPSVQSLPKGWEAGIPKHRALIASFASRASSEMFALPKGHENSDTPWPSERTWDMASRVSAACETQGLDDSTAIASLVGEGPALVYVSWRAQQDLPDPEACLANAKTCTLPSEDEKLYVVLSSIAAAVTGRLDLPRWTAAWVILGRVCAMNRPDVATVAARVLAINKPQGWIPPKEIAALLPMLKKAGF